VPCNALVPINIIIERQGVRCEILEMNVPGSRNLVQIFSPEMKVCVLHKALTRQDELKAYFCVVLGTADSQQQKTLQNAGRLNGVHLRLRPTLSLRFLM